MSRPATVEPEHVETIEEQEYEEPGPLVVLAPLYAPWDLNPEPAD